MTTDRNKPGAARSGWPAELAFHAWKQRLVRVALAAAGIAGVFLIGRCTATPESNGGAVAPAAGRDAFWTCSMHPNIRLPKPGQCPLCFMDLIPEAAGDDEGDAPRITWSQRARTLARVETTEVAHREVSCSVRLSGKIAPDETRIRYISSYVPGRLDRLFVDFTGIMVRKGDHLAEIYSPGLMVSQRELILAMDRLDRAKAATPPNESAMTTAQSVVDAARRKLELAGVPRDEIERLAKERNPSENVRIDAPSHGWVLERQGYAGMYVETGTRLFTVVDLYRVWAQLEAYELDMPFLRIGQAVAFEAEAQPGRVFDGRVAYVDPSLNDRTRTVKVRVNVENADLRLRPGMFVRARVNVRIGELGRVLGNELAGKWICPMHPEVVKDQNAPCDHCGMDLVRAESIGHAEAAPAGERPLAVPASAVLLTGNRAVVYVETEREGKADYEGRRVELGPRADDWYVVLDGLAPGERVVTRGALAIDSALQIKAKPSLIGAMEADASTPGDGAHGDSGPDAADKHAHRAVAGAAYHATAKPIIDACLDLSAALAADDLAGARGAAARAVAAAKNARPDGLPDADAPEFTARVQAISAALPAEAAAASLDDLRGKLPEVTAALESYLRTFGHDRAGPIFRAYCPMAFQNKGAAWLQAGETIQNAYFASKMLRCGEIRARIGADGREAR